MQESVYFIGDHGKVIGRTKPKGRFRKRRITSTMFPYGTIPVNYLNPRDIQITGFQPQNLYYALTHQELKIK
jgi:hypothetical protein